MVTQRKKEKYRVVCIGGGNGQEAVVLALTDLPEVEQLTSVVNVIDRGGSTGRLRHSYKMGGHTGDAGRVAVAAHSAKETPDQAREELMQIALRGMMYRFPNGCVGEHTPRNILITGITKANPGISPTTVTAAFAELIRAGKTRVLPVTDQKADVRFVLRNGQVLDGEEELDKIASNKLYDAKAHIVHDVQIVPEIRDYLKQKDHATPKRKKTSSRPRQPIRVTKAVDQAIRSAHCIVATPGDLFTSVLPPLSTQGMKEAIMASKAKIVVVLNIMTKEGETQGFTAETFLNWIESKMGRPADIVIANSHIPVKAVRALGSYTLENKVAMPTKAMNNMINEGKRYISAPLAHLRGTLKHDPKALRKVFKEKVLCESR